MREVTILSPHRDDAAFSLGLTLRRWRQAGVRVRVVNFFTSSAYAPRAAGSDKSPAALSALRKREDRQALRLIDPALAVRDWRLVDAPLRLARDTAEVLGPNAAGLRAADIECVAGVLSNSYTVAPLGLGDHVDHRTVLEAALKIVSAHRLAFYQDLPYAAWTPQEEIQRRIEDVRQKLHIHYRPVRARMPAGLKRRIAGRYATQISPEEARRIATSEETLWIPARSAAWIAMQSV